MFASISPCASNTCYIYIYIYIDIHELIYVSSFHVLSFDLMNSKHCCLSLLYDVIMNSQNSTSKLLRDCFYKDVVFRQWYEEVNV
jgi:hypothetical protein